jgi:hypothetical protein
MRRTQPAVPNAATPNANARQVSAGMSMRSARDNERYGAAMPNAAGKGHLHCRR